MMGWRDLKYWQKILVKLKKTNVEDLLDVSIYIGVMFFGLSGFSVIMSMGIHTSGDFTLAGQMEIFDLIAILSILVGVVFIFVGSIWQGYKLTKYLYTKFKKS